MNFNVLSNIVTTVGIIALATTLVLPNRNTAKIIGAGFTGAAGLTRAAEGL